MRLNIFQKRNQAFSPVTAVLVLIIVAMGIFIIMGISSGDPPRLPERESVPEPAPYPIECGSIPPWGIARLDLENAIEVGDLTKARTSFQQISLYREESVYCVGESHMEFFAPKKTMKSMKKNLDNGDMKGAQSDLYYLASSCGEAICHKKRGVMGDLELSYFDLKDNVNDGDMVSARASYLMFKKAYFETKRDFRRIVPAQSNMMDEKFIANLEVAMENNDLALAKRSLNELSEGVCTSSGCHGSLMVGR